MCKRIKINKANTDLSKGEKTGKWEKENYPESYIQADSQIHKMLVVDAHIIF